MSAYVVLTAAVDDPEIYKEYTQRTPAIVERYGGRFLARGGRVETIEGEPFHDRLVILEFPTVKAIHQFFGDPEYKEAAKYRKACSTARILAVDGVD